MKQFRPWAGNEDFRSRLLCVLISTYTKMFEGKAAPEAKICSSDAGSPARSRSSS